VEVAPIGSDEQWQWCSVEQAAALLGISTPTVRRRIREGGPPFRLPDGSRLPVTAERLTRAQGSRFSVRLPAALGVASAGAPAQPDAEPDASLTPETRDPHTSSSESNASVALVELVRELAEREVEMAERIGQLRAQLERSELDLDGSRREVARVSAAAGLAELRVAELEAAIRAAGGLRSARTGWAGLLDWLCGWTPWASSRRAHG
jgi:excisionase family DNA binding protein